ncbi:MAG TPA: 3-oxoacyl-[acyl-carrier-protein] synthase III C-terminal domain-containing protein [Opitutaceae bacterium]
MSASVHVLRDYGNMSSPSILFVLDEILRERVDSDGDIWMTSFGAGFSAHTYRLAR